MKRPQEQAFFIRETPTQVHKFTLSKFDWRDALPPQRVFSMWITGEENSYLQAIVTAGNYREIIETPIGIAFDVKPDDPRLYLPWDPIMGKKKKTQLPMCLVVGERPTHTEDYLFTDGYIMRVSEFSRQPWTPPCAPTCVAPNKPKKVRARSDAEIQQRKMAAKGRAIILDTELFQLRQLYEATPKNLSDRRRRQLTADAWNKKRTRGKPIKEHNILYALNNRKQR